MLFTILLILNLLYSLVSQGCPPFGRVHAYNSGVSYLYARRLRISIVKSSVYLPRRMRSAGLVNAYYLGRGFRKRKYAYTNGVEPAAEGHGAN